MMCICRSINNFLCLSFPMRNNPISVRTNLNQHNICLHPEGENNAYNIRLLISSIRIPSKNTHSVPTYSVLIHISTYTIEAFFSTDLTYLYIFHQKNLLNFTKSYEINHNFSTRGKDMCQFDFSKEERHNTPGATIPSSEGSSSMD